jgi:hypothetical protein
MESDRHSMAESRDWKEGFSFPFLIPRLRQAMAEQQHIIPGAHTRELLTRY